MLNLNNRYYELDSLRGIAAFTVLLSHFLLVLTPTHITKFIEYGPLRVFVAGGEAVTLFFILSGFVLFLPFQKTGSFSYLSFISKRILRIYTPYYISLLIALILLYLSYKGSVEGLSNWFNHIWSSGISIKLIFEHLILIGSFPNAEINPVLWSLVHEMRISFLFPILVILVKRYRSKNVLLVGLLTSSISWVLYTTFHEMDYGSMYDFSLTIHFISMFLIGALLAKNRNKIIEYICKFTFRKKFVLFFIGLFFYLYVKPAMVLKIIFGHRDPIIATILDSYCVTIGAIILIILSLSSKKMSNFLLKKPIHFLGKISYSLYLYHSIILLSFIHLFSNTLGIPVIWLISLTFTLFISTISYYLVELPSIRIGRKLFSGKSKIKIKETQVFAQK